MSESEGGSYWDRKRVLIHCLGADPNDSEKARKTRDLDIDELEDVVARFAECFRNRDARVYLGHLKYMDEVHLYILIFFFGRLVLFLVRYYFWDSLV